MPSSIELPKLLTQILDEYHAQSDVVQLKQEYGDSLNTAILLEQVTNAFKPSGAKQAIIEFGLHVATFHEYDLQPKGLRELIGANTSINISGGKILHAQHDALICELNSNLILFPIWVVAKQIYDYRLSEGGLKESIGLTVIEVEK